MARPSAISRIHSNTFQCLGCGIVSPRQILLHDALVSPVTAMRSDNFTPASIYRPSPRPYPRCLPPIEYPGYDLPGCLRTRYSLRNSTGVIARIGNALSTARSVVTSGTPKAFANATYSQS